MMNSTDYTRFEQFKSAEEREWERRAQVPERKPVVLGYRSLWQKIVDLCKGKKRFAVLAAAAVIVIAVPVSAPSRNGYLGRLESMRGTSYMKATCSGFICQAKGHAPCSALQFWTGCGGDLEVIQQVSSLAKVQLSTLQAGDVLDFNGSHVAVYVGNGQMMDSVPERGVGTLLNPAAADLWYSGSVRILRWQGMSS
jgi:hypothetical protein